MSANMMNWNSQPQPGVGPRRHLRHGAQNEPDISGPRYIHRAARMTEHPHQLVLRNLRGVLRHRLARRQVRRDAVARTPATGTRQVNGDRTYQFFDGAPRARRPQHHAAFVEEPPEGRCRALRPGSVDDQAPDAQSGPAVRVPQRLRARRSICRRARSCRRVTTRRCPAWRSGTTSRRGSAAPTTCSATARRRSRPTWAGISCGEGAGAADIKNPQNTIVNTASRAWTDAQRQLRARLRSPQPRRQRRVRAAVGSQLRQPGARQHDRMTTTCSTATASGATTGRPRRASSTSCCRACR